MLMPVSFDYAVLRIVPRVDREEFLNAGALLFSAEKNFLGARIHFPAGRLLLLWPQLDVDNLRPHLDAFLKVCRGEPGAGPIAQLSARERFHWLAAPRSTTIQVSPVHSGLCEDPALALDKLFRSLILIEA